MTKVEAFIKASRESSHAFALHNQFTPAERVQILEAAAANAIRCASYLKRGLVPPSAEPTESNS